jgi:protoporphyrinogen oxidase
MSIDTNLQKNQTRPRLPFVVLGGGPCGLSAAWHLASKGERVVVVDRESQVGGLCATHVQGGYRFDLGGHRFVSADLALTRWLEGLLGDELLTSRRKSVVLHEGRAFRYPLEARDLLHNLGWRENTRAALGYARARARHWFAPTADVTFEDWVTSRFGRPLYDTFFGPYTEKLWGISPRLISADWAAERISLLHLGDAAARLLHLRRPPIRTYAREYRYPRLGMGQLYDVIAREIVERGGEVRTATSVTGLETAGDRVVAVRLQSERGEERIPARAVVSTIPLPDLVGYLSRGAAARCGPPSGLRFRSLVFLNLMLARETIGDNTWMYVASAKLRTSRIQQPNKRSPAMAPPGKTSVMLEIPCDRGDAIWNASVPELRTLAARELAELGVETGEIVDAFSVKVEHGYPIYHLGYEADRQELLRVVEAFANVRTAGRQGLFRYVFMDAAMQMGTLAAEQLLKGEGCARHIDRIGRSARVVETTALTA